MPFPWKKKARVNRISRIVADLQQPKRGGSLVLQTGFPTSLVDLFVKNRTRFSRSKPKKPSRPDPPLPPPPPPSPVATPPPQSTASDHGDPVSSGRAEECESGSGHRVVGVAVRILVVAVSMASVDRLTVGITISAFALLLLEYAAKRTVSCSWTRSAESYACDWFQRLLLRRKSKEEAESEPAKFQGEEEAELLRPNSSPLGEIEVVETESEESVCVIGPEPGLDGGELKRSGSESEAFEDDGCSKGKKVLPGCKAGSRSFKSKMVKRLVPKKFRNSKKMKESEETEQENNCRSNKRSQLLARRYELECKRDEDHDCGITTTDSEESSPSIREQELNGRVGNSNSGYKILIVIALAGLVIGRFQALILIMGWCFMLKISKLLWRSQIESQDMPRL